MRQPAVSRTSPDVRVLLVSEHWPWPEYSGARQRMAATVESLAAVARVDVLHIDRGWDTPLPLDDPPPAVSRYRRVRLPDPPPLTAALRRLAHPFQPADLARLDGRLTRECRDFAAAAEPDLVWCNKEVSYAPIRRAISSGTPLVIDIDDLYEMTARRWRAAHGPGGLGGRISLAHLTWTWRLAHRRHARRSSAILLCSDRDAARVGASNAVTVPNSYRGPSHNPRTPPPGTPPTILFQGLFTYFPNEDAARILATEVFPRVRARVPRARLLLVGHHGGRLADIARLPGITATGQVPDMEPWLDQAHLVAVALRAGSGTRTKILEAVAHGLPIVSTSIGIEGLDFEPGHEVIVSDEWPGFAAECARLLDNAGDARDMATRAQAVLARSYAPEAMRQAIQSVVRRALG